MTIPHVAAAGRSAPPDWAVRQRELMALMDRAARRFVDHATRPDGTLIQRTAWTSMDGTDNGYEAFLSFPLAYLLGGGEYLHELARREWDAITWQYANYGTVEREFVTGFDWFQGNTLTHPKAWLTGAFEIPIPSLGVSGKAIQKR